MAIRVKLKRMQKKSVHQNITYSFKQQIHQLPLPLEGSANLAHKGA